MVYIQHTTKGQISINSPQVFLFSGPFGLGDLADGAAAAGGRPKSRFCISLASSALRSLRKLSRFVSLANANDVAGAALPPDSWSTTCSSALVHQSTAKRKGKKASFERTSSLPLEWALLDPWSPHISGLFEYCFCAKFHLDPDDDPSWPSLATECILWGALWLMLPTTSWPCLSVEEGECCAVCFLGCSTSPWNALRFL